MGAGPVFAGVSFGESLLFAIGYCTGIGFVCGVPCAYFLLVEGDSCFNSLLRAASNIGVSGRGCRVNGDSYCRRMV